MNRFHSLHRKLVVGIIAPLLVFCGLSVTFHSTDHFFHKHTAYCEAQIAAEKTGACPSPCLSRSTAEFSELQTALFYQSPFHTDSIYADYRSRAPPVSV